MTERRRSGGLMRLVQQAADIAAVAQARYLRRLEAERPTVGGTGESQPGAAPRAVRPRPGNAPSAPRMATPPADESRSGPVAAPDPGASAKHAESREQIGDADARPAPPEPASPPAACRDHVVPQGAWPTVKELFRRYGKDQCPAYAAALSFFSILSIVPMLVVALAALAFVFQDPAEAVHRLQRVIANILPGNYAGKAAEQIMQQANVESSVKGLIATRGIAGVIGLLSLVWASMQIFVNGAPAMNAAFEVEEKRGWIKLRLIAFGLLLGAGALFLLSLAPSSGPEFLRNLKIPWLGLPQHVPWYIEALFWLVALALNMTMFALIYRFLPNAPATWRESFVGGLVAGLLWEMAKQGFSYYLAHFNSYNKVYGTLGGLIVLVLWIYYTSMILLLGAESAALYRDVQQADPAREGAPRPAPPVPVATTRRARA